MIYPVRGETRWWINSCVTKSEGGGGITIHDWDKWCSTSKRFHDRLLESYSQKQKIRWCKMRSVQYAFPCDNTGVQYAIASVWDRCYFVVCKTYAIFVCNLYLLLPSVAVNAHVYSCNTMCTSIRDKAYPKFSHITNRNNGLEFPLLLFTFFSSALRTYFIHWKPSTDLKQSYATQTPSQLFLSWNGITLLTQQINYLANIIKGLPCSMCLDIW